MVTVVMATYNRSNVLRYAIESVRRQTWADWELLVVGDQCTDDSASVVASFGDPRIRFWNVAERCGEQSGPNNAGFAAARGRYLAVLNHDDLWTTTHLHRAVGELDGNPDVDLVYTLNIAVSSGGRYRAYGPSPSGEYEAQINVPASGWVFRPSLLTRVGPWPAAREVYEPPSQAWLRRAKSRGARLRFLPHLGVISLPSGDRAGSYANRSSDEHARWFAAMTSTPHWDVSTLVDVVCQMELVSYQSPTSLEVRPLLRRAATNLVYRGLVACGISPHAAVSAVKYRRRRGLIDHLRRVRGLDLLPRQ